MRLTRVTILALLMGSFLCQRYAESNNLPVEHIEKNYSKGYDFDKNKVIHRWYVEEFPHPRWNFLSCNRMMPSFICDPDKTLNIETADKLDFYIGELYRGTPCICDKCNEGDGGIVVGIAMMKNIYLPYNENPSQIIRSFAERLRKRWMLGKCDNDMVIVVANADNLSSRAIGKTAAAYLSLREASTSLKNFYTNLSTLIEKKPNKTLHVKVDVPAWMHWLRYVLGLAFTGLFILIVYCFIHWCGKCKRKKITYKAKRTEPIPRISESVKDIKVRVGLRLANEKSDVHQACETEDPASTSVRVEAEVKDTTLAKPDSTRKLSTMTDSEITEHVRKIAAYKLNILPFPKTYYKYQRPRLAFGGTSYFDGGTSYCGGGGSSCCDDFDF